MKRRVAPALALAIVLFVSPHAQAGAPTDQLRGFFASASAILADPATEGQHEERLRRIRDIARRLFDVREAAQLSLGTAWDDRTPAEQDEFARLYGDLLERAFIAWVAARVQVGGGVRITFLGEARDGDQATVRTSVLGRSGDDLPFDYRMIERGRGWAVRDVVIDGVSLTANFRAQFARVLQASSYAGLLRELQARAPTVVAAAADHEARAPSTPVSLPIASSGITARAGANSGRLVDAGAVQVEMAPVLPATAPTVLARATDGRRGPLDQLRGPEPAPAREPARGLETGRSVEPARRAVDPAHQAQTDHRSTRSEPIAMRHAPAPKSYWVQVAAFRNVDAATRLVSLLRGEDRSAPSRWTVTTVPDPAGASLARVRVGPFARRADAASSLRRLEARGFKPFIAEERE